MQSHINLLPDSLANQIAAGEVVQRPASVVKELLENAVDAGATRIDLVLKDAGKTLIQVTDNGSGMSAQDARMCFERHATSKIHTSEDLFNILTLGFRGEALASIAAVAQVRLQTRLREAELGTAIEIAGSTITKNEPCQAPVGTSFLVKNLFFNVPARRNFLKSNPVETRHVVQEFLRVALPNPQIAFSLTHNDVLIHQLAAGNVESRAIALFGNNLTGKLLSVSESSDYVQVHGLIGTPDAARKERGEQFLFVNNRFIKSTYLDHALKSAYEEALPRDTFPFYCLFLTIAPIHVDINIHPTKTEVKFDDERAIYTVLRTMVRRAIGGGMSSSLMSQPNEGDSAASNPNTLWQGPHVNAKQSGPARDFASRSDVSKLHLPRHDQHDRATPADWNRFYTPETPQQHTFAPPPSLPAEQGALPLSHPTPSPQTGNTPVEGAFYHQIGLGNILTQHGQDLLIINQRLAHQRILYEELLEAREGVVIGSQQLLFPTMLEFSAEDFMALQEATETLVRMGFDVAEFGPRTVTVRGLPAGISDTHVQELLAAAIEAIKTDGAASDLLAEHIARATALRAAVPNRRLNEAEMRDLDIRLFRCEIPNFAPNGKPTYRMISQQEIESWF